MSTKIHAVVDALGNPLSFHLTPGHASDLDGADQLLPNVVAETVLGDKGYDADARVIELLQAQGKTAVIPISSSDELNRKLKASMHKGFSNKVVHSYRESV